MNQIKKLSCDIAAHVGTAAVGRSIRSGFRIVLAGPVNAGKSSLFNALLGSSRAIVSDRPGTTTDFISAELDIGGYLVELIDTAGLRETKDEIEGMGVERTKDLMDSADLVVNVMNPASGIVDGEFSVITHGDLYPEISDAVSVKTGQNIDRLVERLKAEIQSRLSVDAIMVSNEKTAELLHEALGYLNAALAEQVPELAAENVRLSSLALGKVLGDVDFDEIQSAIFGRLCLGK
jgi:tRNA modification GTPase